MKKILPGILTGLFLINLSLYSQVITPCTTDEMNEILIQEDPEIIEITRELEEFTQKFIKQNTAKNTYVIPVVFHIMHNGGVENITKSKVEKAIEILNEDFSATNQDLMTVIPEFENIIGNADIEFRLARIDPEGNFTEGIVKVQTEATYRAGNNVKYISPAWDRAKYLNIWSVSSIGNGAAGYSQYPGSVQNAPAIDGIVVKYNYVGRDHVITHEVGHYLNLIHPWGSTNNPDVASNCQTDDYVDDTPNTIGSAIGNCNLNQNTCGSLDNVQNIMDYSSCDRMFSEGQVVRMHAALNSNVSSRNNLWSEANLIATGTNEGYDAPTCSPIASVRFGHTTGCEGYEVRFEDLSYNGEIQSRLWSFPGGTPSESSDSLVTVMYENPGYYDVSFQVSNEAGSNELIITDFIWVIDTLTGYNNPVHEDFENAAFPVNNEDESLSWTKIEKGDGHWEYTTDAAFSGNGSVRIKNYLNGEAIVNTLISPNINMSDFTPGALSFRMAYAKKYNSNMDELRVYLSRDCGVSWSLRYLKSGSSLSNNTQFELFIPGQEDWRLETINMTPIEDWKHLRIKIEMESFGGNCLYIDDLRVEEATIVTMFQNAVFTDLEVYPNPVTRNSIITFYMKQSNAVELSVLNIYGQEIYKSSLLQNTGKQKIEIRNILPDVSGGIYFVKLSSQGFGKTVKVIKY